MNLVLVFSFYFICFFKGLHPQHMQVPRLGAESELQLPTYTTATAARGPSRICDLHRSSRQRQIPDPLSEAREGTRIHMDTSWIPFY